MSARVNAMVNRRAEHPKHQSFSEISLEQRMWASGDYASIAAHIVPVSERLAEAADLQAGWRGDDVATGMGNAALAAARLRLHRGGRGLRPGPLERGRRRAEAEGFAVELVEGDAERLPVENAGFDAVLSVFGVMFAPDQEAAARELVRLLSPRRDDRARELDAVRLHRRDVPGGRAARGATRWPALAPRVGHPGTPAGAAGRRRGALDQHDAPTLHVPLPVAAALRRVLPPSRRPDFEGLRSARARGDAEP